MISIQITEHGIQMSGHAQCKESDGIDRACAAVSALTCNLINSLMELTGDRIRADTESGMAIVEWEKLSDKGKLLVDSWFVERCTIFGGSFKYYILYFAKYVVPYIDFYKIHFSLYALLYHYMTVYTNCFFLIILLASNHINIIILLLCEPY